MRINLGNTPLFRGMTVPDIEEMLRCLRAVERTYLPCRSSWGSGEEKQGSVQRGRMVRFCRRVRYKCAANRLFEIC